MWNTVEQDRGSGKNEDSCLSTLWSTRSSTDRRDVEAACTLYSKGAYQPVIDRTYPLNEIVEAHRYVDTWRKKGNVVIRID